MSNLNKNLTEINCEVVLRGKEIGFRPSIEELKDKFYKEIK